MAKLPIYNQQVTRRAVQGVQKSVDNSLAEGVNKFTQGAMQYAQVQNQMQAREARDFVIGQQNETSVALAERRQSLSESSKTGSEYTDGLKEFIETQKSAALENAPTPKAAESAAQYYNNLMSKELEQAVPVAAKMNAKRTATVINESLEIGLNQTFRNPGDFEESLANATAVIDSSDLPDNVKETAKAQYTEKLSTQKLLGIINQDPKQAVKDIESGNYDSLDPDTLNQLTSSAHMQSEALDKQNKINAEKQAQKLRAEQEAINARATSDLEIGVSRGDFGLVEIEKAYNTGMITPDKRTSLTKQVDSLVEKQVKANNSIVQVSAAIEAGQPLDYRNKDHKSAVDSYYANMPEDSRNDPNAIAGLVKSTKVIPTIVESALNAGLKGSVTQVVQSADLLSRMNEQAPEVIAQLPEDTKAVGIMVSRLVASGVDQAKAVELANNSVYNTSRELKDVLKTQLTQSDVISKKSTGFSDAIDKISPSFFSPERTASMDRMEANFNYAVDQYYLKTHDIDTAMKLATTDISKVWGSTWINGKETLSKYPIEKMYGNGEESPWIYNQLKAEMKELGVEGKISLQADSITAREKQPSYIIMTEQDGVMIPYLQNGIVQRFTPDFNSTPEKAEAEQQKVKAMEQAKRAEKYVAGDFRYKTEYGVRR